MRGLFHWMFEHQKDVRVLPNWFWWEKRRIPAIIICAVSGFIAWFLFEYFWASSGLLGPGEDPVNILSLISAYANFFVRWNVCYFALPVIQIVLTKVGVRGYRGPALLKLTLAVTCFLLWLPAIEAGIMWTGRVMKGLAPVAI